MDKKGLVLLSGGLDSTLAAKIMQQQGIQLEAINFFTCFCTCTKKGCRSEARKVSELLGINLKILNVTQEYLEIVEKPKYGYGSNMNPCIDCRIFMFKKAKEYMEKIGASFLVTGEVLGERPMSQRLEAMRIIERDAGLEGLIVRPLSARLLKPTIPEMAGIVDREKLLAIQGRSRRPQIELAKSFNITDYPCPAGGCLLTDPGFSNRIKDLLLYNVFTLEDIQLLKIGRHFRITPEAKLIVGRNKDENERLLNMALPSDIFLDPKDVPGPIGLLRTKEINQQLLEDSASIISRYSDSNKEMVKVIYWANHKGIYGEITASPALEEYLTLRRI